MTSPWIAAAVALFLWWFSTGVILCRVRLADRSGRRAHLRSVVWGLPFLVGGLWGLVHSAQDAGVLGVYLAFLSALAVWGWIELAFLSGQITGPNRTHCPAHTPEWKRFLRAWGTIAYHELALVGVLTLLVYEAWGAPNPFGLYTFGLLFFARISAKLNLFYGVPRINTEFLPETLLHLPSHFRHRPMNPVFPISVSVLSFVSFCWIDRLLDAAGPAQTVGFALVAALTLLALLEHWFMVLPLPDAKLWRWMLPAPKPTTKTL